MRVVVQRVTSACVCVDGEVVGEIEQGLLVLLGVKNTDETADAEYIADKLLGLRIFEDENEKMNLSVSDVGGSILLVSQFTLFGDARKGKRPSFIAAARPDVAIPLYETVRQRLSGSVRVETGRFGADMAVSLINDGPVTILLDSERTF